MKHLQTYKIFESSDIDLKLIEDMFIELKDNDFVVNIHKQSSEFLQSNNKYREYLKIELSRDDNPFKWDDVKYYFEISKEYIEEENYSLLRIGVDYLDKTKFTFKADSFDDYEKFIKFTKNKNFNTEYHGFSFQTKDSGMIHPNGYVYETEGISFLYQKNQL
jgi:hypothetical protein